jgi:tetratricopeptide (TPR) repeat protein
MLDSRWVDKERNLASDSTSTLTEAIAAVRTGDRARARELLSRLLRAESQNAEYWIWMSSVVDIPRERIYCLESALRIDPTNRAALRGLAILGARRPDEKEIPSPVRLPKRKYDLPGPLAEPEKEPEAAPPAAATVGLPKASPSTFKSKRGAGAGRVFGMLVFGAAGVAIIAAVIFFVVPRFQTGYLGFASTLPAPSPTATDTPLPGTPTATPIPAATRIIRTPIPTEFFETPLALFIASTATPTPIAGYTPHPSYEAYDAGIKALQRGDYEQAIDFFDQVLTLSPNLPDALYFKAEAQRMQGAIGAAIKTYDEVAKAAPDYAAVYLGRGRALLERDTDAALRDFERAVERDPALIEARLELAKYYSDNKLWQKQSTTIEGALAAGASSPRLMIYLSEAYLNLARFQSALNYALEGSADDPAMLEGYLAVGRSYVALGVNTLDPGYFSTAIWPLQTYTAYSPGDERGWAALGRALVGTGQYDQALKMLDIALEINDRYAPAYMARAILNTQRGEYKIAYEDILSARRFGPESFDLFINAARILVALGDPQLALRDYTGPAITYANSLNNAFIKERELGEIYALQGLIFEANPDVKSDAIRMWNYVLSLENALPSTKELAQQHYDELTGIGPTRTATSSPTISPTRTSTPGATSGSTTVTPTP